MIILIKLAGFLFLFILVLYLILLLALGYINPEQTTSSDTHTPDFLSNGRNPNLENIETVDLDF